MKSTGWILIVLLLLYSADAQAQATKKTPPAQPKAKTTTTKKPVAAKAPVKAKPKPKPATAVKEVPAKVPVLVEEVQPPAIKEDNEDVIVLPKKNTWEKEAGIRIAVPVRLLHIFQVLGFGLDGAARTALTGNLKNIYVGGRLNYMYFIPKTALFGTPKAAHLVSVLADVQYKLPQHFIAGGGLGLGLSFRGAATAGFAKAAYAGYEMKGGKHDLVLTLFYTQMMVGTKHLGINAAMRF